jgi:hypothetical protein
MKRINIKVEEWATGIRSIVMAIAIGLFAASCGDKDPDDGDGGISIDLPAAKGHLTVTGLDTKYNGKSIFATENSGDNGVPIVGCTKVTDIKEDGATYHCVKIENGSAKIPLYYETDNAELFKAYDKSDKNTTIALMILSNDVYKIYSTGSFTVDAFKEFTVSFTDGDATVDWTAGGGDGPAPDMGTWTEVENTGFGNNIIYGVAYGTGKFVAVGDKSKMAYSTDGITWTMLSKEETSFVSAQTAVSIYGIAYDGNGTYVAVGQGQIAYLKENINN